MGKKTALELMHRFGSLDALYEQLDSLEIRPAVRRKLEDGRDSAYLSRELGTICREAPVDPDPEAYRLAPVQKGRPWPGCWPGWNFSLRSKKMGLDAAAPEAEVEKAPAILKLEEGASASSMTEERGGLCSLAVTVEGNRDALTAFWAVKREENGDVRAASFAPGGRNILPCWPGWPTPPWR